MPKMNCRTVLIFALVAVFQTSCKAQETEDGCPASECDIACSNGFQTDMNGCEICACNRCPQVFCALFCDNGFRLDSDNCPICQCNDVEQCENVTCQNVCPYGRLIGEDGCLSCDCNENPCQCQEDEICVINSELEWMCVKSPGENETCEREDKEDKDKSGSKSKSDSTSKSGSSSASKSRSGSKSKSNSRSKSGSKSKSNSRSKSGSKSRSRPRSGSNSRSNSTRSGSKSHTSNSRPRSGSKSKSYSRPRSGTNSRSNTTRSGSKSNSSSRSKSGSKSRSHSRSRSGSKSRSASSLSEKLLRLLSSKSEKEEEREERRRIRQASRGATSRNIFRDLEITPDSCQPGFYCRETSNNYGICSPISTDGPCYRTSSNPEVECDESGFYKLRICYENDAGITECICVHPENGTRYEDTRVVISSNNEDDKPNCIDSVFGSCTVTYNDRIYSIRHGGSHYDRCNCQTCKCYFGQLYCDEPHRAGCSERCYNSSLVQSCSLSDGTTVAHGQTVNEGCKRCYCRDGRLICTRYRCRRDEDECGRCSLERVSKVCGPNMRTYSNRCTAEKCAGWDPLEVLDGPCASHNPCARFPCESGEICLRRGGVSCLAQGGCDPSDVRACVNITRLPCDFTMMRNNSVQDSSDDGQLGSGDIDPTDTAVCASDGNSYPAICHVIPNYLKIRVVHAGRCDDSNCRGGSVCGTDGETYANVCFLRSQSSNARVDYRGECLDVGGTIDEYCEAVVDEGRCEYSSDNCDNLVQPSVGCCPVCGSATVFILDLEDLQDAALIDPTLTTLDDLVENLLQAYFFDLYIERCNVEASLTDEGHLELVSRPMSPDDQDFCNTQLDRIVEGINSYSQQSGRGRRQVDSDDDQLLPSTYQFVLEAGSTDDDDNDDSSAAITSVGIITFAVTVATVLFTIIN